MPTDVTHGSLSSAGEGIPPTSLVSVPFVSLLVRSVLARPLLSGSALSGSVGSVSELAGFGLALLALVGSVRSNVSCFAALE